MLEKLGKRLLVAIALSVGAVSGASADVLQTNATSMRARAYGLEASTRAPTGSYGYVLMDAQSGRVIAGRNTDELFIPASLAKIPTSLIALSKLGEDRRFRTKLISNGQIVDGMLQGDLHLIGSGDPSLRTHDLLELLAQLSGAGVHTVSGRFTYHSGLMPTTAMIDTMQPADQHYNPPVSGLNLDLNVRTVKGRRVPIKHPALHTAMTMKRLAAARGIELPFPQKANVIASGVVIATHRSAPLSDIITRMMARSTNLTAESLGSVTAASFGRKPASLSAAAAKTSTWLREHCGKVGGTGWNGFSLVNHSGLSSRSRATPRQVAAILRLGYQRFGKTFINLHKRVAPPQLGSYDLHGKVGTMQFVRGYAGFLTVGGRDMIFTIMINDGAKRALVDAGRKGFRSARWMNRARKLERALLSDWIADQWPRTASR